MRGTVIGVLSAILVVAFVTSIRWATTDSARREAQKSRCILACQSIDVTIDGKRCGCITWKELP